MVATSGIRVLEALTPTTTVAVDHSRCVRHRCNRNECRLCIDACPTGAIAWGATGLTFREDACTECLLCEASCPTAAFRSAEFDPQRPLAELAAHAAPVLGCRKHAASESHARVPCLGAFAHPEAMTLLALVFTQGLTLNLTACGACRNGEIVAAVRSAHARLADVVADHRIALAFNPKMLEHAPAALSRREMFARFRARADSGAARRVARLQDGTQVESFGAKGLPERRRLLRRAMDDLTEPQRQAIADRLFGHVAFTPSCRPCSRCAAVCPTGALRRDPSGERSPAFDPAACVTCNSCEAFCQRQGIETLAFGHATSPRGPFCRPVKASPSSAGRSIG